MNLGEGAEKKLDIVLPRILAGIIALPLLVIFADIIGVFGGYLVAICSLGFESTTYIQKTISFVEQHDVISGLIKALFFGMTICTIGCYNGYYSAKGAQGVGNATTNAVVVSSILILSDLI